MNRYTSNSLEETQKIAADWLARVSAEHSNTISMETKSAFVAGLSGHLGAGKTAFTKLVAKELGIGEEITSPTFVIMKIYDTQHPTFKRFVHIDAYRLERAQELEALDFERITSDSNNLVLIEWPENVGLTNGEGFKLDQLLKFEIRDGMHVIEM